MEQRLGRALPAVYGSLILTFVASVPSIGWWPVIALAGAVLHYRLLRKLAATSQRPEYWIAWGFGFRQLLAGGAIALTGGPTSPLIPWLVVAASTLPLRFTTRGIAAGLIVTTLILLAATAGVDPSGLLADPTLALMTMAVLVCVSAYSATLMRVELEHRSESTLDPLSGLLNRRTLLARLEELRQQAQRSGEPLCLVACDIDEFKSVNDLHGHDRGDLVLCQTAEAISAELRSFELAYRLGGDEFLIVLPGADLPGGVVVAERLRAATEQRRPGGLPITVSIGVAVAHGPDIDCADLLARADEALYDAKDHGRNRVAAPGADVSAELPLDVRLAA